MALLGHEFGHFVNGDSRRGLLTGLPASTLAKLVDAIQPSFMGGGGSLLMEIAAMIARPLVLLANRILLAALVVTVWVTGRDGQQAEYLADRLAARAGGSAAAAGLLDSLLVTESMVTVIVAAARRGGGPGDWRVAADRTRLELADRLPRLRQLAIREDASLFRSHPPASLRARMIELRPPVEPAVVLTEENSTRIDVELRGHFDRVSRDLINL